KLSIVDVKARDASEQIYQIEIQLLVYGHLSARILYTWADIYSQQLQSGNDYRLLKPTYSIWLLAENLIPDDGDYLHAYQLRDAKGRTLLDHGGIWLLELDKFSTQTVENEQQRWLQFFKAGEQLDDAALPDWMTTPEMRQAMTTLRQFSEKERNYHEYQARQNYLRQQRTIQWEMEEERKEKLQALLREQAALQREQDALMEKEAAMQEKATAMQEKEAAMKAQEAAIHAKEAAMQEKEAALAEIERLKMLLADK
ncbi:MAG TPA: Rpn family recombination-promoting nuclease/putative transposase, partial [Rhodocyclaceae bacterium]|nr:Rpn family recombination-promoting nuclease/putative transposase [Rhodocyclaceae bacterium]